jgi:hypothetical protein
VIPHHSRVIESFLGAATILCTGGDYATLVPP